MFRTKRDVDRHVTHITNKIRDEKERNSRGYQFAKLYYEVGDYVSSQRYLQAFLSVRETTSQAHKLMGQVNEALHDKNGAIESYKRSLDLDSGQTDLVLKVCQLYSDPEVNITADQAQSWIEKAEECNPDDFTVFKLKERVIGQGDDINKEEMEKLINKELSRNYGDVKLHIKLLKLYMQAREVDRAYKHAVKTEKSLLFVSSRDWYDCVSEVYQVYQDQHNCGEDLKFYTYKLFSLCSLVRLRLESEDRDLQNTLRALQQFDVDVFESSRIQTQNTEWTSFLTEMKGQLFYLLALVLLKKALKGQVQWKDATSYGAVCFLLSDTQPSVDLKSSWFNQISHDRRKFYERFHLLGAERLSQGGHMIMVLGNKRDETGQWALKLRQRLCTTQGKESLFNMVFSSSDFKGKKDPSFLLQTDLFTNTKLEVPSKAKLIKYDSDAFRFHMDSLNQLVWLCMHYYSNGDELQPNYERHFGQQLYPDMKFSANDLSSGDPATLSRLDVQVFLYASIQWVASDQREKRRNLHTIPDRPDVLPVCLTSGLCTPQQSDWWTAVNKLENKSASDKMRKYWGVLIRGLETVRLLPPHTLPLSIIVQLAKTLDARAKEISSQDGEGVVTNREAAIRARADFYWSSASDILDKMDRNVSIKLPKEMLFPSVGDYSLVPSKKLQEQVKLAIALINMREDCLEEALEGFESVNVPEASYYAGQIYKRMAESVDMNGNSSMNPADNLEMNLLYKSKTALYQTLDRLETDKNEELKQKVEQELKEVCNQLITMECGGNPRDSILSNNAYESAQSEGDEYEEGGVEPVKQPGPHTPISPVLPTPKKNQYTPVGPSPTRVDMHLRALEATNTALSCRLLTLEESVKTNGKLVQELISQLRETREENKILRDQLQLVAFQGLSGMSAPRPAMPPSFPGTPQARTMLSAMNSSFGAAIPYDYAAPAGIPPHMAQYGYPGGASPRPGSAYGQPNFEDEYTNVDGEYYDPDAERECYIPDQNLVQEWPFGNKAGVEGKSTITYSPQHQGSSPAPAPGAAQVPANAGMFVNALRGPSIQYGGYQQQAPQLPGPGYFSQSNQYTQQASLQTQAGMFPGQAQMGLVGMKTQGSPVVMQQKVAPATVPVSVKPFGTMMPPNAVASPSTEVKPKLIPGSVGVPTPKKDDKPQPSVNSSLPGLLTTPTGVLSPAGQGQTSPGSAASMLSKLASQHQEQSQGQAASSMPAATQSTPQKTVFGGFSFTSTPKISETKAEEKVEKASTTPTTTVAASKPFSGFSFTVPSTAASQSPAASDSKAGTVSQAGKSPFTFAQNSASFGNLASTGNVATGFQASGDGKGFSNAGQPLFGKSPSPRRRDTSIGSDDHVEEYEPNVDFKPVVPLPDLVEVKTGEEDEEKLFCDRAKLFRFDGEGGQWKERGIGEMKILKHKQSGICRILMRREQVLKLCANHRISNSMKLTPMSSSDKAWVWDAMDFSEEEMKSERFAIKFKTADIAAKFKTVFESCQTDQIDKASPTKETILTESKNTKHVEKKEGSKQDLPKAENKSDLSSLFKPKAGSWACEGCYVQNNGDVLKCPCCGTLKPGVKPGDVPASAPFGSQNAVSAGSGFSFGSQGTGSGGFTFASKPDSAPTGSGFTFVSSETSSAGFGGFKTDKVEEMKLAESVKDNTNKGTSKPENKSDLSSLFKPKAGSWACDGCYVQNNGDVLKCPCCGTLKPGVKPGDVPASAPFGSQKAGTAGSGFSFGSQGTGSGGFTFGSKPDSAPSGSGFTFASSETSTGSSGGFKLGTSTTTAAPSGGGFTFGTPSKPQDSGKSSGFTFGSPATTKGSVSVSSSTTSGGFTFGSAKPQDSGISLGSSVVSSTTSDLGIDIPQPCGPSSGFRLGEAATKPTEESTKGQSSAGFDVSKDTTKYVFGQKETATDEKGSKPTSKAQDFSGSLLAKVLSEDTDPIPSSSTVGTSTLKPSQSLFGTSSKGISGGFNFASTSKSEGFNFSLQPSADNSKAQAPAALGTGFNFSLNITPTASKTSPAKPTSVTSPKSPEVSEDGYYVNREDEDQHIHFEPVIELPDKIDVKTGEEEEEVIFCHRAKLFRFSKGEWKERGLGDIKVLFNAANSKARLLMRREQILKLCCNHYITSDINFQPMPNSKGCALVWYAMDFSEDAPSTEQFSIKFKTAEIVSKFQDAIQTALKKTSSKPAVETICAASKTEDVKVEDSAEADDDVIFVKEETASSEDIAKARELQLPDNFFLYKNSPPCPGCRGCDDRMPEDDVTEPKVNKDKERAIKPKADDQDENQDEEDEDEDYEDDDEEDEEEEDEDDDEENARSKDDAKTDDPQQTGIFGAKSSLFGGVQASGSTTPSSGGFVFGNVGSSSGFSFSDIAASSGAQSFQTSPSKPFQWQGAGKQLFGAGGGADNDSGEEEGVEQGDDPHFEPIVPLPDLIEVKTGEEDETVEFSQRAKLFRFDKDANQWKEKGIGEMKILKHKQTNKYRLLLRREQVHKLACNHLLTPDLRLTPLNTSETSWCWSAQDFSDSEPKLEQLAIKFKTIDQANTFKAKFEEVQAEQSKPSSEAPLMSSLLTGDLDD